LNGENVGARWNIALFHNPAVLLVDSGWRNIRMPRRRTYSRRERTHNYSWKPFYPNVTNPASGAIYLIDKTEVQDFETVLQRQRGLCHQRSGGDEVSMVIASTVLPNNMTSADFGGRITETNFPDPLDDDTDDWALWTPLFVASDIGSIQAQWDSKSKRRIPKDEVLYTVLRIVSYSGASINMQFIGRHLQSWRN